MNHTAYIKSAGPVLFALIVCEVAAVLPFLLPTVGDARARDLGDATGYRRQSGLHGYGPFDFRGQPDLRGQTQGFLAQVRRSINDYQTSMATLTSRAREADQWTRSGFQSAVREYQRRLTALQRSMLSMQVAASPLEWSMRRAEVEARYAELAAAYRAADAALRRPVSRGPAPASPFSSNRGYHEWRTNPPRQGMTATPGAMAPAAITPPPAPGPERGRTDAETHDHGDDGGIVIHLGPGDGTAARREILLGDTVVGPAGEVVGRIDSFLSGYDGMIKYAVIMAMDERLYPVPSQVLRPTGHAGRYLLSVGREQMKDAPSFTRRSWPPGPIDRNWHRRSFAFYNGSIYIGNDW